MRLDRVRTRVTLTRLLLRLLPERVLRDAHAPQRLEHPALLHRRVGHLRAVRRAG